MKTFKVFSVLVVGILFLTASGTANAASGGEAELIGWLQANDAARITGAGFPLATFTVAGETRTFLLGGVPGLAGLLAGRDPAFSVGYIHARAGTPCVEAGIPSWSFCLLESSK